MFPERIAVFKNSFFQRVKKAEIKKVMKTILLFKFFYFQGVVTDFFIDV